MRFGSVCSGIEAASVAWLPLGWQAAWFSEIEPFPCAALAHHYPSVPNLGDMTTLPDRILSGEVEAPDLFCGGTPCQAFSVAGLRRSLDDARGNLSLTFCKIANAIDAVRLARGELPAVVFWENVPGVLSTADNAFGCFLGALAGCDTAIVPSGRWTDAGVVDGPQRTVAWRVFNAEHFGLAQRRRRVFVVASARDGFDPAAVLLEWEGVRRDSAPSREAGKGVARGAAPSFGIRSANTSSNGWGIQRELTHTLDTASPQFVAHTLRGEGFDASEDGPGRGTPLVPVTAVALTASRSSTQSPNEDATPVPVMSNDPATAICANEQRTYTNEGGMFQLRNVVAQPVAVPMVNMQGSKGNAVAQADGPSYTLNAMHGHDMHAVAVVSPVRYGNHQQDTLHHESGIMSTLPGGSNDNAGHYTNTVTAMQVRRLTPRECERLQGFPDDYTLIPWRGKPASECPDGPRYKALGNSWAVPVVRWIGRRIQQHCGGAQQPERRAA